MFPLILTVLSPYTAFLAVIFLTVKVFQNNYPVIRNPWNTGMLLLFTWSMFVGIINKNILSAAASLVILCYFFTGIYVENNFDDEAKIDELLQWGVIASLIASLIGIIEKISAMHFHTLKWGYALGMPSNIIVWKNYRISSTFGNPNIAGDWFSIMCLVCVYFFFKSSGRKKFLYGFSMYIFIFMLNLTGSRGAAVALLCSLLILAIFMNKKDNLLLIASAFIIVSTFMLIIPQLTPKLLNTINTSMNHDIGHSVSSRQAIWKSCFNLFKEKPVTGVGLLGIYFSNDHVLNYSREPHAHNLWLTLATMLGVVGLAIYIYMKTYLYKKISALIKCKCQLASLLLSIQALYVVHGFVDFTIMAPQTGILFIISSSMVCALNRKYSSYADESDYSDLPLKKRELLLK